MKRVAIVAFAVAAGLLGLWYGGYLEVSLKTDLIAVIGAVTGIASLFLGETPEDRKQRREQERELHAIAKSEASDSAIRKALTPVIDNAHRVSAIQQLHKEGYSKKEILRVAYQLLLANNGPDAARSKVEKIQSVLGWNESW